MGAEKRLQKKLDRMGKKKGNTVDIEDGKQEVGEFIRKKVTLLILKMVSKKLESLYKTTVQKVKNVEQQNFMIK